MFIVLGCMNKHGLLRWAKVGHKIQVLAENGCRKSICLDDVDVVAVMAVLA